MSQLNYRFLLVALVFVTDVFALVAAMGGSASRAAKLGWILVIVFLPVIGIVAWWRRGPGSPGRRSDSSGLELLNNDAFPDRSPPPTR